MGGLAGHMMHLHENLNLTFGEIKNIFSTAAAGELSGTEKVDGINLFFTFDVDRCMTVLARNKGQVKDGGLDADDFLSQVRPTTKRFFEYGVKVFDQAVKELAQEDQIELFGYDGEIFYNVEIVYKDNPNVIPYDKSTIIIHRTGHIFLDKFQKEFYSLADNFSEIEHLFDSISNENFQVNKIRKLPGMLNIRRFFRRIDYLRKQQGLELTDSIEKLDSQDRIQKIIYDFSNEVLESFQSSYIQNSFRVIKKIEKRLQENIVAIEESEHEDAIEVLNIQRKKLKEVSTCAEGFVFEFNGNVYKFTGTFAPINQINGLVKFGRGSNIPPVKQYLNKDGRTYALYPGKFKPPHRGHYEVMEWVFKRYKIDKLFILISSKTHEGYNAATSRDLWLSYLKDTKYEERVKILTSEDLNCNSPVRATYRLIDIVSQPKDRLIMVVGNKDGEKRYKNIDQCFKKRKFVIECVKPKAKGVSSTDVRKIISDNNKRSLMKHLPKHLNKEEKNKVWDKVSYKHTNEQQDLEEMSMAGAGAVEGHVDNNKKKDELTNEQKSLIKQWISSVYSNVLESKKEYYFLQKMIEEAIILEKQEDMEFSKYYGINVLNHEVLAQIKDDIHTKTKSLGDDEQFIEYFKRYVYMYLSDLIDTEIDIDDIENEVEQIRGMLNEAGVRLQVDPSDPTSPIDNSLLSGTSYDSDPEMDQAANILGTPTKELDPGDQRELKRQSLELPEGGQEDAKKQAMSFMNDVDDIILAGLEKISDELNRELFIRYLAINIMLHIDKAYNEMRDDAPELDVPGYNEEEGEADLEAGAPEEVPL